MQDIFVQKPYQFVPPIFSKWGSWLGKVTGIHRYLIWKMEGVKGSEVLDSHLLEESISAGHSIMLTPNHSRTADPLAFGFLREKIHCHFYAMASWHLFNLGEAMKLFIRSQGAFSVNREGMDRKAVQMSIELLEKAERLLVVFPEGSTSRTNDVLRPFLDGFDFIARSAAKKRNKRDGGKTVIHPIGFKYVLQGDAKERCLPVIGNLEKRLSWTTDPNTPVLERLTKIAEATQTLREIEFLGKAISGTRTKRVSELKENLLSELESKWLNGNSNTDTTSQSTTTRIKNLRQVIFPDLTTGNLSESETQSRMADLRRTYIVDQMENDPLEYLKGNPTNDRLRETVERLEEDLTDKATIARPLKCILKAGKAIEVSPVRPKRTENGDPLVKEVHIALQGILNSLENSSAKIHL